MNKKRSRTNPRQIARRAAVLGLSVKSRLTGRATTYFDSPGSTILLLHNTLPRDLARLTDYIDRHRARFISFHDALPLSDQATGIALSFDDGFASNLTAGKLLAERGLSACFYIPTDVVGLPKEGSDAFFRRPQDEGVLAWREIEELRDLGHVIGSHARQHVPLTTWTRAQAEDQIKGSIAVLRGKLGEVDHFAWPYGGLQHAPVDDVVRWCREIGVLPASGRRGKNSPSRFADEGYLRRDAADLRWLATDVEALVARPR